MLKYFSPFSTKVFTILTTVLDHSSASSSRFKILSASACALRALQDFWQLLDSFQILRSGAFSVYTLACVYRENATAGPLAVYCVYTVKYITMRVCVTCASNSSEIDIIYRYCQDNGLLMHTGAYIHADESYWIWRIETEACPALTWLLLKYPDQLRVF